MERPEFLARCKQVCEQAEATGEDIPKVVSRKAMAFAWEIMSYGYNEKSTRETVSEAVADMYISLMAIAYTFGLSSDEVGAIIDRQLGK